MSGHLIQDIGPDLYAVRVVGDSMVPRYDPGDWIYVDPSFSIEVGRDLLVYTEDEGGDEVAYVLNLTEITDETLVFRQFKTPDKRFRFDRSEITKIHTVVATVELAGGRGPITAEDGVAA